VDERLYPLRLGTGWHMECGRCGDFKRTGFTDDLTRKVLHTYVEGIVVTPDREPVVFGAMSDPVRRPMFDPLVEADKNHETSHQTFDTSLDSHCLYHSDPRVRLQSGFGG